MKLALMLLALVSAGATLDTRPAAADTSKQEKKGDAKEMKWQGTVLQVLKDQSILNIRGGATAEGKNLLKVAYDSSTQWTKQNKPGGSLSDIKEGSFIIVEGKVDEKGVLHASRIDLRLPR